MAVQLKWNGEQFKRIIRGQLEAGLDAVYLELLRIAKHMASVPNRGVQVTVSRPRAGGNATSRTISPYPSYPGEPPRARTGFGRSNIVGGRNGLIVRVGYTRAARYMTFHELGIRYTKAGFQQRPLLVPAVENNVQRLRGIFERAARAKR